MNLPDGDTFKVIDWLWTLISGALLFLWKLLTKRHDDLKAETMEHIENVRREQEARIAAVEVEVVRQRDVAAKIFDKLEVMSKESADRHERLFTALHIGLATKADK